MNKTKLLFSVLFGFLWAFHPGYAQVQHFIYLEAAKPVTFTVKADQKTYTSSANGYLIISKLPAGNLVLRLQIPGTEAMRYQLNVEKDAGYLIRQSGTGEWGLYDMVSFARIPTATDIAQSPAGELPKQASELPPPSNPGIPSNTVPLPPVAVVPVLPSDQHKGENAEVVRMLKQDGRYVYLVSGKDTVNIELPASFVIPKTSDQTATETPALPESEKPLTKPVITEPASPSEAGLCKEAVSADDLKKFRQELMAIEGESAQLDQIRKAVPCLRTDQVAGLAALFKTDRARYEFFDLAYPKTVDSGSFYLLEQFIKDEYYIKRFRAILR